MSIPESILSGLVGGVFGASIGSLLTARFNLKSGRAVLTEKWMDSFRKAVSKYLGIVEGVQHNLMVKPDGYSFANDLYKLHGAKIQVSLHLKAKGDPPNKSCFQSRASFIARLANYNRQVEVQNLMEEIYTDLDKLSANQLGTKITENSNKIASLSQQILGTNWHDVEELMRFDLD